MMIFWRLLTALVLTGSFLLVTTLPAQAQEVTPTPTVAPTPTPNDRIEIPLSSGRQAVLVYEVTVGDIAIVTVGLALLAFGIILGSIRIVKLWLR